MFRPLSFAIAVILMASSSALAADRTVTLNIPGMDCPSCPFIIKKVLTKVEGVRSVRTSVADRTAVVVYDDVKTTPGALTKATGSVGYESTVKPSSTPEG